MGTLANKRISSFLLDNKYRVYRHLCLQIVILMITVGVFFDAPDKMNLSTNRILGWVGYYLFMNMLVYFNAYILFPRFLAKNKIFSYAISLLIFTIFALLIMMILQEYFYDIAVTHQEEISGVAIFLSIVSSMLAILLFLGGISALLLFKRWMISRRRTNDLRLATSQSALSFLKSQINPHFLFNMLNNANILVDEDPDMASYILVKLDDLIKYQINDSTKDKVYLDEDINFLTDFLDLEKIRRDQFTYTISKEGETHNLKVPPLLFIPFVENAVKHNSDSESLSYINIGFTVKGKHLAFTCKNSKPIKTVRREVGGLGLANIKKRLDLLYGANYSLQTDETDTTYTVDLRLTLHE